MFEDISTFSIKQKGFASSGGLPLQEKESFLNGNGSCHMCIWKTWRASLKRGGQDLVYYIRRDVPYEKADLKEERERGFLGVCYCLVSKEILKHCLMESDVDLVWWRLSWRFVWWS